MSEMVMVIPVIALTGIVLVGILAIFRKYMAQRDRLDAEMLRMQAGAQPAIKAAPKAEPRMAVLVQTRRHAA